MKKRNQFLLIAISLLLFLNTISFVSAKEEPPAGYTYRVYGYAKDSATGYGVSGVTVRLYKYVDSNLIYLETDTTSSSGSFYFVYASAVPLSYPDLFKVKLTHPDYNTVWKSKPVNAYTNFGNIAITNPVEKYAVLVSCGGATGAATYDDTYDFKQKLTGEFGFASQNIVWLAGTSVTKTDVQNAVTGMANGADPNDKIVFFYEGHGSQDSDIGDPNQYNGHLKLPNNQKIYDNELLDWLDGTRAPSVFVFIGACYSGTFVDDFANSPQKSKFLVVTATQNYKPLPLMVGYTWSNPGNPGTPQIPIPYNGPNTQIWSNFFLPELDSGNSIETSFSSGYAVFQSTYPSTPRWDFTYTSTIAKEGYWTVSYSAWSWNEPDSGPLDGAHPQIMDGSTASFYL